MTVLTPYPAPTALAWAAGFFDGEGSVGRYRQRAPYEHEWYVHCTVGQKDRAVLDRFAIAVGLGVIYDRPSAPHCRYQYALARRRDVMLLCWMLWPWLSNAKREQFARALDDA